MHTIDKNTLEKITSAFNDLNNTTTRGKINNIIVTNKKAYNAIIDYNGILRENN